MIYKTKSFVETRNLGARWGAALKPGSILGLVGNLGSGKTCFVQGLAEGLGIQKEKVVSSPTYILIQEYLGGRLPLYHFDFYRLEKEEEAIKLGLEEYWGSQGVSVVEWADHFPKLFPETTQWIYFKVIGENLREVRC